MRVDLLLDLFGADMSSVLEIARAADDGPIDCLWVTDHFSGAVVGAPWTRGAFASLGAIAAVTNRVDVGLLVANANNRHVVRLATSLNTVQSIAPGRVRLGLGSGAAPGSRFAIEFDMVGQRLGDSAERRAHLVDTIAALRAIWAGDTDFERSGIRFHELSSVVDGTPLPPVIVGASSWETIDVALSHADGVNVRATSRLGEQLERLARARPPGFEVSVLDPIGGVEVADVDGLAQAGVDRVIFTASGVDAVDLLRERRLRG